MQEATQRHIRMNRRSVPPGPGGEKHRCEINYYLSTYLKEWIRHRHTRVKIPSCVCYFLESGDFERHL